MNITRLVWPLMTRRAERMFDASAQPERTQRRVLADILRRARGCEAVDRMDMRGSVEYEVFSDSCRINEYADIRQQIMRMMAGERNVLWPGRCRWFAQSSGTSDGRSKYIPVTDISLSRNHYFGASQAVAHYLLHNPESRLFDGKAMILGGSFNPAPVEGQKAGAKVGDLSATLISRITPLAEAVRVPKRRIALMADWEEKLPRLVEAAAAADVTNLSGVPSWMLTVVRGVLALKGARSLHEVWPNLEVFFHGGIGFEPYRGQYLEITDARRMHFVNTYNASEGFFAVQNDPGDPAMLLLADCGIFYEFQPLDESQPPVPLWQVKQGEIYSLVITGMNGLWRYPLGDTVRIESTDPVKISIAGRTKSYINAFGEELMVHNADAALARTCRELGCSVINYTAAPVYTTERSHGRHQWLVEFSRMPESLEVFADTLDRNLTLENSDYAAKRAHSIFLDRLSVTVAPQGLFDRWLARNGGKLGGQRKIPRLANDRRTIDDMLAMI